jgi:hypothetical protein
LPSCISLKIKKWGCPQSQGKSLKLCEAQDSGVMKGEITGENRALTPDNKQHNLKIAFALCTEIERLATKM